MQDNRGYIHTFHNVLGALWAIDASFLYGWDSHFGGSILESKSLWEVRAKLKSFFNPPFFKDSGSFDLTHGMMEVISLLKHVNPCVSFLLSFCVFILVCSAIEPVKANVQSNLLLPGAHSCQTVVMNASGSSELWRTKFLLNCYFIFMSCMPTIIEKEALSVLKHHFQTPYM